MAAALLAWMAVAIPPAFAGEAELRLTQVDGAPLVGAVFSAVPLDGRPLPPPVGAVMDQRGRMFRPFVLVVQQGATVKFTNGDEISHHVYSFSPVKRFDFFLTRKQTREIVFDRPGVVALGCNIHDWMLAYILVVESPWFVQTDADGRAKLSGLPAGRYELRVWHPRLADSPPSKVVEAGTADRSDWAVRLGKPLLASRSGEPTGRGY